ncbi:MAG: response regulator [Azonexus sp.]
MNLEERHLLIIDDDESYREVLSRSLSRKGFVVVTAANVEESLACCRAIVPEYILLDLNLAGQSGLNLIQPLLDIAPEARIVILTGYASIQTAVGALKLGAVQYLPKPASVADIVKALIEEGIEIPEIPDEDRMTVQHLEWEYIQRTLGEHSGNIAATARALKMHRRTLQRKLAKKRPSKPMSG